MRVRVLDGRPAEVAGGDERTRRRREVERRLRLVVGRRAAGISRIDVSLGPDPGGCGAEDGADLHRCRIHARLEGGGDVVVDERGTDIDDAIEVATWRLDHRLDRPPRRSAS